MLPVTMPLITEGHHRRFVQEVGTKVLSHRRGNLGSMVELTLDRVTAALRDAWSRETCDPVDVADWHPGNPARGQCGVTALVLHDYFGGELLLADVTYADGTQQGVHYWNRLPDGSELDLTRDQFTDGEQIGPPEAVPRTSGAPPTRCREQYELLRRRVTAAARVQS